MAQLAWLYAIKGGKQRWNERTQVGHTIGSCQDDNDAHFESWNVLLKRDVLIHRDEYVELTARTTQELAVLKPSPTGADHCLNVVAPKFRYEVVGE